MLSGYPVAAERMSGDKVTRADAAASQANIGRLGIVRAPWNAAFLDELAGFPWVSMTIRSTRYRSRSANWKRVT